MKIIFKRKNLVELIHSENNLGFVPTMGGKHLGHLSLIRKSIKLCNKTIVSIFINKPQFNKKYDYKFYPRILNKDIYLLKKMKVDFLYFLILLYSCLSLLSFLFIFIIFLKKASLEK